MSGNKAADFTAYGVSDCNNTPLVLLLLSFLTSTDLPPTVPLPCLQMTFGLFLKLGNALYFKNKLDVWAEAVPQLVFMIALFGYMVSACTTCLFCNCLASG